MRSARLAVLASLLAAAPALAQEAALSDAALAADDACAAGADAEACELSLRQLRGQAAAGRGADPEEEPGEDRQLAMYLSSSFSEGEDDASHSHCDGTFLSRSPKTLYSAYSENEEGASWHTSSVVLSVDSQKKLYEEVDVAGPVGLRLSLKWAANDQKTRIRVGTLQEPVPRIVNAETGQCQRSYCRLAKPDCGEESCSPESPMCGFNKLNVSLDQPIGKTLHFNVTRLLGANFANRTSVQVYVVPEGLDEEGFWETPKVTVAAWHFFNYGASGEEETPWDF